MGSDVGKTEIVWRPTPEQAACSRLAAFMREHSIPTFDELMRRSTEDIEWFWDAVIRDLDIQFYTPYQKIVDLSDGAPWARWCVGGRMNIIHNCLDKWIGTPVEKRIALRWEGEDGTQRALSYGELHRDTGLMAAALRRMGIGKGDVMAVFMPMTPEIVVAMFAASKIGAIALPLFSGYGPEAVASRLASAAAKVLFTADGCSRRGQVVNMKNVADIALAQAGVTSSVNTVIVVKRTGEQVGWTEGRDRWWHEAIAESAATAWTETEEERRAATATEQTDAEDPMLLIYTSGTTGQPKGAVHTHCGFPIKGVQDMVHCFDVQSSDTVYWVTDMGWMMGPWLIYGTTLLGATMLLYEGAPDYPDADRMWQMVERHGVTVLGISPTLVRSLMQHGDEPVKRHNLSSLRVLGSTGEPWNPDPWRWFFETVGGGRLPIINYSGGTEISGGILGGNLLLPVKPTAFSAAIPGMAVDVVNERGESVRGEVGELVIRKPWIGMTRGFWKDRARYMDSYWSRFPGIWTHGDWAEIDAEGMWYILGRSDDTIKVAGKRLGPAEVESVLVSHDAVAEAGCVGVPDAMKGQEVVCFCVLTEGTNATEQLREELRELVAQRLGKPLKPRTVKFVTDLPKTRNAKLMRRVIRSAYLNEPAGDLSSLENPSAVEGIRNAR